MSKFPSMPLFTDAFIADTIHLNAQETGAYLMLMMVAWRSPECRLADDDDKLARFARVDARTWRRIKPTILAFFSLTPAGWTPSARHAGPVERTSLPLSLRQALRAQGECAYCDDRSGPFEIDHVVPLARGGTNDPSNLTLACQPCNRSKRAKLLSEWVQ